MYYIHTDHINTPRVVTTTSNQVVWRWDNDDAFGNNPAQALPLEFNLRFSGQYFDNENNLHYNYYRTYFPKMGRYLQSDPIGLNGGLNTYAYVNGNPLNGVDPLGLLKIQFASPDDGNSGSVAMSQAIKNDYVPEDVLAIYYHGDEKGNIALDVRSPFNKSLPNPYLSQRGSNGNYWGITNAKGLFDLLKSANINLKKFNKIELRGCSTGKGNMPQQLSNLTGLPVEATPDYIVWGIPTIGLSKKVQTLGTVKEIRNGELATRLGLENSFKTYYPGK